MKKNETNLRNSVWPVEETACLKLNRRICYYRNISIPHLQFKVRSTTVASMIDTGICQ